MIPVAEARSRILAALHPTPAEQVALPQALGRVLAADVRSRLSHPPAAVSAMDGWAVRAADLGHLPATLVRIGESPAGHPFPGTVGPGQAVRIFTGGVLPAGADTVVMQEDCTDHGDHVRVGLHPGPGRHVRPAGLDFAPGDIGLRRGRRLGARDIALAAAMNVPWLAVHRRPRIAILATGDEVRMPGEPLGPGQIVSSNALALAALITGCGGEPVDLGIAADRPDDLLDGIAAARGADLLVTTGGASVGDHDLVRTTLAGRGLALDFWRIAMRPGKPLMFGALDGMPVLGLPGSPVSSLVCAILFLRPALATLQGLAETGPTLVPARTTVDLAANDGREDYLRATLAPGPDGLPLATPFPRQDSLMLTRLAWADALLCRPPHAPAAPAGSAVEILPLWDI